MQLHEERLERLRRRVAKADKTTIVAFPYRLQPSLAVTEYDFAGWLKAISVASVSVSTASTRHGVGVSTTQ